MSLTCDFATGGKWNSRKVTFVQKIKSVNLTAVKILHEILLPMYILVSDPMQKRMMPFLS